MANTNMVISMSEEDFYQIKQFCDINALNRSAKTVQLWKQHLEEVQNNHEQTSK